MISPSAKNFLLGIVGQCKVDKERQRFGVFLDEMNSLGSVDDPFDANEFPGCKPPIADHVDKIIPVCKIILPSATEITINQMAYNQVRTDYTVIIYGPRRSGKSKWIKHFCYHNQTRFPNILVFTMTKASGEYMGYVPERCIIDGLDEDLLLAVIYAQKAKKEAESRGEFQGNYSLLIILDDCMAEKLRYKDIFNSVFYNGRHYNITLIVAVQDVKGISPASTFNADLVLCFAIPDKRGRDTMREKFCDYLDKHDFNALMDCKEINRKYHMLCFDIAHRYNDYDSRIYFGCVDESNIEPFVMGCRDLWENNMDQLKALGFGWMINILDWGIEEPEKKEAPLELDAPKNSKIRGISASLKRTL